MIAKKIEKVPHSGIREFFDLVLGMPEVISLGVGEPDFVTPWRIREKAITALEEGITSYTSNKGLFVLRQAISQHYKKVYKLEYNPEEEILITVGVSEGLDLALRTILEPNDRVVVVSPHYVAYPALVEINGGRVEYLVTAEEQGFKICPKSLSDLLKKDVKAVILNYPCNPTGVTYSKEELTEIAKVILQSNAIVISDEIYGQLTYVDKHYSFASFDQKLKERTIVLGGFSKGHAMTGFRVGFACGNQKIISAMMKIHSFSMLCAPVISQVAACEAFKAEKDVLAMRLEYKRRKEFMVKELNRLRLKTINPQGAFYCFPSLKEIGVDALTFAKKLLFEEKVAVVPGAAFGKQYHQYLRISYANTFEQLKEAIARMERLIKRIT